MPTVRQSSWVESRRIVYAFLRGLQKPPRNRLRRFLWKLARSSALSKCLFVVLLTNILLLCTVTSSLSDGIQLLQNILELVFTGLYVLEVGIQFVGRGPQHWARERWRIFGAIIAIGSLVAHILETSGIPFFTQLAKVSSALRILLLMRYFQPLRMLLVSIGETLPDLFNVIVMLMLIFWIFAYIAVLLFGNIRRGFKLILGGYSTFGSAMLNLFSVLVLDNWCFFSSSCIPFLLSFKIKGRTLGRLSNFLSVVH